ncbi:MAG: hypothetical protein JWL64_2259, partial [Frankiales bacterium]|nr:hypothetical protein [Frankiales bacterium]
MSRTARATVLTLAVLFPLAACGENGPEAGTPGGPAVAAVPAGAQPVGGPITVSITGQACELGTQVAFAGTNVLHVINTSPVTAEVYVYDGPRVV